MKSAHEEKLVGLVQASLDRDPIDHIQFLNCFTEENKFLASFLIGHIVNQRNQTEEILKIVTDLSTNQRDNKISIVNVSKLFILYPNLLKDYDYDIEKKCITYEGKSLANDSEELTYLSIELETYFGSRDIPHSDLLKAIKRYFLRIHKEIKATAKDVELLCQEYLAGSKTRQRTRIPQKFLRDNLELPLPEIKSIMADNGYVEWKDKSKTVYFYKLEN